MTNLQKIKYYTVGDKRLYRMVLSILIPIVIQNTVTNVVSLLDNVMVGATDTLQMSAVAIVNQLLFIFYLAIFGGYAGAGIFAAQYVGAKDNEGVRYCFRAKLYIGIFCLCVAALIFGAFSNQLISMYLAEDTSPTDASLTLGYGKDYLNIMLLGLPFFALSQCYGSTLREMGETKIPMFASVTAIVVNLCFNYVFIFGNEGLPFLPFGAMGAKGAAIATVISRVVEAAIIGAYVHAKSRKFRFIKGVYRGLKIPKILALDILKKGSPLLVNEIFWSMGVAAIMQCYSMRGLDVVAAMNISNTINNLFNVIFLSMGNAIAIIIGQMLGANKINRARVTVWRLLALSVATCFITAGIMAIISPFVPNIYNVSESVKNMATQMLLVVAIMTPFLAFTHGCYFTLRSGGKTVMTFIFDCGFSWLLSFPLAFVLAHFTSMPIIPLYICVQLIEVVKSVIGAILVRKGVWINNIVRK